MVVFLVGELFVILLVIVIDDIEVFLESGDEEVFDFLFLE